MADKAPMKLSDVKNVEIAADAVGKISKFILITVFRSKESKIILRSSDRNYHDEIKNEVLYSNIGKNFDIEVNGGGKIFVDKNSKKIYIWGISTAFGLPDFEKAKKLLEETYKDYEILIREYK